MLEIRGVSIHPGLGQGRHGERRAPGGQLPLGPAGRNLTRAHGRAPAGTFLNPVEFDEANNWSSRYMLLECYRKLVEAMLRRGIHPKLPDEDAPTG